jgi:prevent-host-death family protein
MKKASISILKAHLSRYVDAVKSGEEVIVTERGRPVARLGPLGEAQAPHGRVAQLVREGRMRPPMRPGAVLELLARADEAPGAPADPDGRSLAALLEERAEGR